MTDAKMSLDGKRVIAIGGSSGIGFAVAALAREQGAEVVIASSKPANVDAAVARLPGSAGMTVDLRDEAGVSRFFDQVGAFDHLAITAGDQGLPAFGATRDLDLVAAREALTLRFWGSLAAVKHASRVIAANGSITLTGGLLAHRPQKGMPFVTAAAGAMESLARGLAVDLAPVRVNAVCPGLILTERVKQMPEERVRGYVAGLPVPRAASPSEAAAAYVYLMLNSYVTGQILAVDGGGLLV
ncbi:NAD(P)-dependent dehydrogenase, short-chain alcohol dehydrogenase family [Bradyrhizobium erythrophlei]|uniref:NAD(P)-dependent dehydrogenase, short-chain alcohol dehydrogenase family n=2 Tax=Bradyrhizobium erythrophlei TaxID=1437360 RepID=A0A1H4UUI7_9BRAD|nr:NAD(P)-dependent dehydrogenase, short-chain alcohol dehydrogenase family [Bradyrhizobium erythrophlei]